MPFFGAGLGERDLSMLFSRDFIMPLRGDLDPSKLCCGERDLSTDPRGDLEWSKLPRGERCNGLVCFKLDLFGDLQTMTLVTRSRSGEASEYRLGDLSLLMLLPLQERMTLIFFSEDIEDFLSGDDLSDCDSCLPSSLTIVGWYWVGWCDDWMSLAWLPVLPALRVEVVLQSNKEHINVAL